VPLVLRCVRDLRVLVEDRSPLLVLVRGAAMRLEGPAVQRLPVCSDGSRTTVRRYSTQLEKQFAADVSCTAPRATASRVIVDGNDVRGVFEATRAARERALAGEGRT